MLRRTVGRSRRALLLLLRQGRGDRSMGMLLNWRGRCQIDRKRADHLKTENPAASRSLFMHTFFPLDCFWNQGFLGVIHFVLPRELPSAEIKLVLVGRHVESHGHTRDLTSVHDTVSTTLFSTCFCHCIFSVYLRGGVKKSSR